METIRPLPAREKPLPGESLASLLRRTADAMGYEGPRRILAMLAQTERLPAHVNHLTPGPIMDRLSELLRCPRDELVGSTVHAYGPRWMLAPKGEPGRQLCDSKTILKYAVSSVSPVCPGCLRQDERPFDRLAWSLRAVPVCLRHACLLITHCPSCDRPIRPGRDHTTQCKCGCHFHQAEVRPVSREVVTLATDLNRWFCGDTAPLPGMSTPACLWWAERLATAAAKTPIWIEQVADQLNLGSRQQPAMTSWLAAADILRGWPGRLETFLDEFQQVSKHRTANTGLTRRFGLLLRNAAHLEELGYPAPADALRPYLLQQYQGGHITRKACLFRQPKHRQLLKRRPWMTQTEAGDLLHLRHGAVADLVRRGVLSGTVHRAGTGGRSIGLVLRESVESFRVELRQAIDVKQTAERLGIGRRSVLQLVHAGVLDRAVRTSGGWRIGPKPVERLLSEYRQLPVLKTRGTRWLSPGEATRRFGSSGLTFVRLVTLIRDRRVAARRLSAEPNYRGLLVARGDLEAAVPALHAQQDQQRGYPLHRLAKALFPERPTKERLLKKWIAAGLLNAERKGRATIVSNAEVARFRATYCLATEACRLLGITRSTLSRWEAERRLSPAYGKRTTEGAGISLYLRGDIERLAQARGRRDHRDPIQGSILLIEAD